MILAHYSPSESHRTHNHHINRQTANDRRDAIFQRGTIIICLLYRLFSIANYWSHILSSTPQWATAPSATPPPPIYRLTNRFCQIYYHHLLWRLSRAVGLPQYGRICPLFLPMLLIHSNSSPSITGHVEAISSSPSIVGQHLIIIRHSLCLSVSL